MKPVREDIYTLPSGDVILQWPEQITDVDANELEEWLTIVPRKIKRASVTSPASPGGEPGAEG